MPTLKPFSPHKPQLLLQEVDDKTIVHPWYKLFKHRLVLKDFKDIKMIHSTHAEFKAEIRADILRQGLLCPLVIDHTNTLRNGNHRFKFIRKVGTASLFYFAKTEQEVNFFSRMIVRVWELHSANGQIDDFSFMFEGKMRKYSEKVPHLFSEGIKG